MNIYAVAGAHVTFSYPDGGYQDDRELAAKHLKVGETYTVESTEVGAWSTVVFLKEAPNIPFNSVCFEDVAPGIGS